MLRIHMLPAAHGDCLLVEYGSAPKIQRILIDGGIARSYDTLRTRLASAPDHRIALLVVTHVDADHIEGIVRMLSDDSLDIDIDQVWFNAYQHLAQGAPAHFGGIQGEYLSALIDKRKLRWNSSQQGQAVFVPDDGPLPVFKFASGMRITLLSPNSQTMADMADQWEEEVVKAGLVPNQPKQAFDHLQTRGKRLLARFDSDGSEPNVPELLEEPYERDTAPANGSSIAFLAEYAGQRILFGADAFSEVLESNIERLLKQRNIDVLAVDAFKLPHHGSAANLSPRLCQMVVPKRILVSSSGKMFGHPDAEAIARIIDAHRDVEVFFNYETPENRMWKNSLTQAKYQYRAHYPPSDTEGIIIDL